MSEINELKTVEGARKHLYGTRDFCSFISANVRDRLDEYCANIGQIRSVAVERIITWSLDHYENKPPERMPHVPWKRPRKMVNMRMSTEVFNRLDEYCKKTGAYKSVTLEQFIILRMDKYDMMPEGKKNPF